MREFMLYVFPVLAIAFMSWAVINAVSQELKQAYLARLRAADAGRATRM